MAKATTPMMEQYNSIKLQYPDAFLFFRLGDFYELFNEDAIEASRILEITLTSRNKNAENPTPMCGVPHHSAQAYIQKLVENGHKVAICEQMEDPKMTKGMVKREVVQVVTPGTIMQDGALSSKENHYLASIGKLSNQYYLAYIDITTGDIRLTSTNEWLSFINELQSLDLKEIVYFQDDSEFMSQVKEQVNSYFSYYSIENKEIPSEQQWVLDQATEDENKMLTFMFAYLFSIQKQALTHVKEVERYELKDYLQMNYYAKSQLEITKALRTQRRKGSLLWLLDQTNTAMGGRLLHQWLDKPLLSMKALEVRHQKVEMLLNFYFERLELTDYFVNIYDLERLVTKISVGTASARDIDNLRQSLGQIPLINQVLKRINEEVNTVDPPRFDLLNPHESIFQLIEEVLVDDPPLSLSEGNIIRDGYNDELDSYREALNNGQDWLSDLQKREREITGLKTLKVGYNKVFGYYIEISRLQAAQLKDDRYLRKQTLTNNERFITEELKEIETKILEASEKASDLEYRLFIELRAKASESVASLQQLASQVAELDVLCNFAKISEEESYVRPTLLKENQRIEIIDGRHPVVEKLIGQSNFVPNNVEISPDESLLLLTGPNMSGKSTYMRQLAYAVIMNQIGCFVAAKEAKLPLIDKIFTRIGSSDDIASGQSTFMVEMIESQHAISQATPRSLILFDEIGRGTSTFDGIALAEAILYYIDRHVHAATVFSTHYHELTALDESIASLKNIHVGATEHEGDVVFLHKIFEGPADKSYGIHVAKLAGLPASLIEHSQAILEELEENSSLLRHPDAVQLNLFQESVKINSDSAIKEDSKEKQIIEELKTININETTPLETMQLIQNWQKKLF